MHNARHLKLMQSNNLWEILPKAFEFAGKPISMHDHKLTKNGIFTRFYFIQFSFAFDTVTKTFLRPYFQFPVERIFFLICMELVSVQSGVWARFDHFSDDKWISAVFAANLMAKQWPWWLIVIRFAFLDKHSRLELTTAFRSIFITLTHLRLNL